jgi:hypothetical protein
VDLGPNDAEYVAGFRSDWERDGTTRFHWTLGASRVRLPLLAPGDGHRLRLRARRHLQDPAEVTVLAEGRPAGRFSIQADPRVAYRIVEVPLPPLAGRRPLEIALVTRPSGGGELGVALDWLEVVPGPAGFRATGGHLGAAAAAVAAVGLCLAAAGARARWVLAAALLVAAAAAAGTARHIVAAERILRLGTPSLAVLAAGLALALRLPAVARGLGLDAGRRPLLTGACLAALMGRLVVLLHPQFFYPDVRVHAMFLWVLVRRGLGAFLGEFTANQFRHSLGLQFENGHWYAFPYPPGFYLLGGPLAQVAGYAPEAAVALLPAFLNSLECLLVFALARRLLPGAPGVALSAAIAHAVLPLYFVRLSLAYFPAVTGHFLDAAVMLAVVAWLRDGNGPRRWLTLAGLTALALLVYTQGLLNLGIVLPLLLAGTLLGRRREALRPAGGVTLACALGILMASVLFYGRYVPTFLDMLRGIPQPEERILLDRMEVRARTAPQEEAAPDADDAFAGPSLSPGRGLMKAAWRLYVFFGPFALVLPVGLVLLARAAPPETRPLLWAWAATYLVLNLASGGLPGPNLFRYNKDLEFVSPLACIALATIAVWIRNRSRSVATVSVLAYCLWALLRDAQSLLDRLQLER